MSSPTKTAQNIWTSPPGQDFLQLIAEGGTVEGWIDSTGTPQGNLSSGGGIPNVSTDSTLSGAGTQVSPLSVVSVPVSGLPTSVSSIVKSGLMAQYRMLPTETPASLVDYSGNGNNATGTVGTAPTIVSKSGGIACTGNGAVILPAALNSALTIQVFCLYNSSSNANARNSPVGGNGNGAASNAIQLILFQSATDDAWSAAISGGARIRTFSPGNTFKVGSESCFAGTGSITFTMGAPGGGDSNDHLFINGTEVLYAQSAFQSVGLQTAGAYQLGGCAVGSGSAVSSYFTGTVYYALFYNRVLTSAEIAQNVQAMNAEMATRGIFVSSAATIADNINQLVTLGDSLTSGGNGGGSWPNVLTLNSTTNIANNARPGAGSTEVVTNFPYLAPPVYKPGALQSTGVVWVGTNDGSVLNPVTLGNNKQACLSLKALGFKVLVGTQVSRSGQNAAKNNGNLLFRQNWATFADGFVDLASDPNIGADNAFSNTTYFQADGVHPTAFTVHNLYNFYFQRAINRLWGPTDFSTATVYTSGAPAAVTVSNASQSGTTATYTATAHGFAQGQIVTVAGVTPAGYNGTFYISSVTTNTFTCVLSVSGLGALSVSGTAAVPLQKDADGYAILGGSSASQNFTLQTAMGLTGQKVRLKNTNTNAWTVTPFASETIDGAASLSLPAGKTVVLVSVLVSASAGGANWIIESVS